MESLYLPILVACAVALMVWAIASLVKGLLNAEKRKLQSRLISQSQGTQRTSLIGSGGDETLLTPVAPEDRLHGHPRC